MGVVKSFSVGDGDMFYIKHGTAADSFTVIDCNYDFDDAWARQLSEISRQSKGKGISRFISTHPDDDHIKGLFDFCKKIGVVNFYCVKNEATKDEPTDDFDCYCALRDSKKAFYLEKGFSRKWINSKNDERNLAGIYCLWPDPENKDYKDALANAKGGESPNNISPILTYAVGDYKFMWMGDMEADFLEKVKPCIAFPKVDILFAPHHGRESGKIPEDILSELSPRIIVIGEAPSKNLNYYTNYNTIKQNSAGDIAFETSDDGIKVFVDSDTYAEDYLSNKHCDDAWGCNYIGTLED